MGAGLRIFELGLLHREFGLDPAIVCLEMSLSCMGTVVPIARGPYGR